MAAAAARDLQYLSSCTAAVVQPLPVPTLASGRSLFTLAARSTLKRRSSLRQSPDSLWPAPPPASASSRAVRHSSRRPSPGSTLAHHRWMSSSHSPAQWSWQAGASGAAVRTKQRRRTAGAAPSLPCSPTHQWWRHRRRRPTAAPPAPRPPHRPWAAGRRAAWTCRSCPSEPAGGRSRERGRERGAVAQGGGGWAAAGWPSPLAPCQRHRRIRIDLHARLQRPGGRHRAWLISLSLALRRSSFCLAESLAGCLGSGLGCLAAGLGLSSAPLEQAASTSSASSAQTVLMACPRSRRHRFGKAGAIGEGLRSRAEYRCPPPRPLPAGRGRTCGRQIDRAFSVPASFSRMCTVRHTRAQLSDGTAAAVAPAALVCRNMPCKAPAPTAALGGSDTCAAGRLASPCFCLCLSVAPTLAQGWLMANPGKRHRRRIAARACCAAAQQAAAAGRPTKCGAPFACMRVCNSPARLDTCFQRLYWLAEPAA